MRFTAWLAAVWMGTAALACADDAAPAPAPAPAATASADPFADPVIQDVQARHQKGVEGDEKAVESLIADLEKLTKDHPDNQLLRAYLGSAYTLRSRDLFPGPGKLKYLKLGLQTMDAAVEAGPNDVAVRFVRAVNNFSMPGFVGRKDTARSDFQILVKAIREPANAAALNVETRQAIYYYAGTVYRQLKSPADAKAAWDEGLALAPGSDLGKKIAVERAKLKS